MLVRLSALRAGRSNPKEDSLYSCWANLRIIKSLEMLGKIKKYGLIGIQTRDIPAFSLDILESSRPNILMYTKPWTPTLSPGIWHNVA